MRGCKKAELTYAQQTCAHVYRETGLVAPSIINLSFVHHVQTLLPLSLLPYSLFPLSLPPHVLCLLLSLSLFTIPPPLSHHYNEDLIVNLRHEREELEEELQREESQIHTLSEILEAVTL